MKRTRRAILATTAASLCLTGTACTPGLRPQEEPSTPRASSEELSPEQRERWERIIAAGPEITEEDYNWAWGDVFGHWWVFDLPFDREAWLESYGDMDSQRYRMVVDLAQNHLPGLTRSEVRALLGDATEMSVWEDDAYPPDAWFYWVEHAFLDSAWLVVIFDERGIVVDWSHFVD